MASIHAEHIIHYSDQNHHCDGPQLLDKHQRSPDPLSQKPAMLAELQSLGDKVLKVVADMGSAAGPMLGALQQCTALELSHREVEMQVGWGRGGCRGCRCSVMGVCYVRTHGCSLWQTEWVGVCCVGHGSRWS